MNNVYTELSALFTGLLKPDQLVKLLPLILNLTTIIVNKGEDRLSTESALYIQTQIEAARRRL